MDWILGLRNENRLWFPYKPIGKKVVEKKDVDDDNKS